MRLHVFAHFGEAQNFISNLGATAAKGRVNQELFQAPQDWVLITGEGLHSAAVQLTAFLSSHSGEVTSVFNWGVSGALRDCKIGEVSQIRTSYAQRSDNTFVYQSFPLADEGVDCISSIERVADPDTATHLSVVADVVDRELWSIASVCKTFQVDLSAFKIVSDELGDLNCQWVKDQALTFSAKLWKKFASLELRNTVKSDPPIVYPSQLYLTHSQKMRLSKLERQWELKNQSRDWQANVEVQQILNNKQLKPKEKSAHIIAWFECQLQPFKKALRESMKKQIGPLNTKGVRVDFDPTFEDEDFQFRFNAKTSDQFRERLRTLQGFDFSTLNLDKSRHEI